MGGDDGTPKDVRKMKPASKSNTWRVQICRAEEEFVFSQANTSATLLYHLADWEICSQLAWIKVHVTLEGAEWRCNLGTQQMTVLGAVLAVLPHCFGVQCCFCRRSRTAKLPCTRPDPIGMVPCSVQKLWKGGSWTSWWKRFWQSDTLFSASLLKLPLVLKCSVRLFWFLSSYSCF